MNDVLMVSNRELTELRGGATIADIRRLGGSYRVGKEVDIVDSSGDSAKGVVVKCTKGHTEDDLVSWTLDIKLK